MAAEFKSHVLRREEKGFAGITFKRLLLAGVGGGMTLVLTRFALGSLAFPVAVGVVLLALILTGSRGGLPLWQRLVYRARGSLMLAVARRPGSLLGRLGAALDVPVALVTLDGDAVFAPPAGDAALDVTEWVTFARADEADHDAGLVLLDDAQLREES